jgi:hypothetical protein
MKTYSDNIAQTDSVNQQIEASLTAVLKNQKKIYYVSWAVLGAVVIQAVMLGTYLYSVLV